MIKEKFETGLTVAAILMASAATATAFSITSGLNFGLWFLAFVVAFLHAVILGIPFYLLCKRKKWTRWWVSFLFGFLIGVLPITILAIMGFISDVPDMEKLTDFIKLSFGAGLLGMLGGVSAWAVWRFGPSMTKICKT